MGLAGRDIICLSTHYWDERRFRKQEFMSRFAEANRVLFVEPSFSMIRRPEPHLADFARNAPLKSLLEQRAEGLFLLKPPRALPKWTDPRVESLTYRWYAREIHRAARRLNFRDVLLWVYNPGYFEALRRVPHRQVVFDLVDDLVAYERKGSRRSSHVERNVTGLLNASDLLVVTAIPLLERYSESAKRAIHIANGFDAALFSERGASGIPSPLREIPGPIIGFVGTLFTFLDFTLLEEVAERQSDKSLVLVGPIEESAREAVARLTALPNVFHIPAQPQSEIATYIAGFDVCVNPFRTGRAADSVNPLKVYEYLAMGRPVVSTPMLALQREEVGRVVAFADGATAFSNAIDFCLTHQAEEDADKRRAAAAPYSWDALFTKLDEFCESALTLNGSSPYPESRERQR